MLRPERLLQNLLPTPTSLTRGPAAVGLFLAGSALALASCTVGPDAPPPTEPPAANAMMAPAGRAIDTGAQPSPRWWLALQDPTLDALVARAEEHNQSLAAAVASVRAAYAAVGASESALWPQIGAGASYSRTLTNIAQLAAAGVIVEPYDTYAYGVGLSAWEIDLWGSVRRQVEAARASAESQVDLLRDALVSVRSQVAASYLQVRTLQQQKSVLLANRDALVKSRDLVKSRYESGVTGRLDLARAEAELDGVEAQVPEVEAGLSSAVATLAVLCGANPGEIAPLVSAPAALPSAPDVAGVGLPEELLERRPDVRAARQRLLAATAAIGVAEAQHFPRLTVSGNFYIAANGIDGLGDLANKAYTIGPSLYLPLFTGGKVDSAVRQQRAEAEASLAQYRQAVLAAVGDVSASAGDFAQAIETRDRSEAALASAREAFEIADAQYRAGVTDFSTLLDVQRAALNAESGAVEARAGVVQGYVALQRALGAGWSAEDEMVASAEQPDGKKHGKKHEKKQEEKR
ncbi:MAG: hypothetical protein RL325_172 [Planctomycetota bacterium]